MERTNEVCPDGCNGQLGEDTGKVEGSEQGYRRAVTDFSLKHCWMVRRSSEEVNAECGVQVFPGSSPKSAHSATHITFLT